MHEPITDTDPTGAGTLASISGARGFNAWMYRTIRPFCKGKILETGSGIGNISAFFIGEAADITLSDVNEGYRIRLQQAFPGVPVVALDLVHPQFAQEYGAMAGKFDTVVSLNVIEHVPDDLAAIRNAKTLLAPGGHLVILVPAFRQLYNRFDKELGHIRRYDRQSLGRVFEQTGLQVTHSRFFNFAGIGAWLLFGSLLGRKMIGAGDMKAYEAILPLVKMADKLTRGRIGLSLIMVGKL